jgi:hypothetical protein
MWVIVKGKLRISRYSPVGGPFVSDTVMYSGLWLIPSSSDHASISQDSKENKAKSPVHKESVPVFLQITFPKLAKFH